MPSPDEPRPHHYEVAHRAIPMILLRSDTELSRLVADDRLQAGLAAIWDGVGTRHAEPLRLSGDGLSASAATIAGAPAVLITFPTAERSPEAVFAAVTPLDPAGTRRYFTLERSQNVVTGDAMWVIGEWRDGSHLNYGTATEPHAPLFLERIGQITSGEAPPLASS